MNPYLKPSFFIIGEQKCGTSSLYRYLVAHPQVLPCQLKEPQFFSKGDHFVEREIESYWALFPTKAYQGDLNFVWPELNEEGRIYHLEVEKKRQAGMDYITGEASANSFREVPPALLQQYVPEAKLIVCLRDPVERCFSSHRMHQRFQVEGRDQGFVVRDFVRDIEAELAGEHQRYLACSRYIDYLPAWVDRFGWEQLKIVFTAELGDPILAPKVMTDLLDFLELPTYDYGGILGQRFNQAQPRQMEDAIYSRLKSYFVPYNQALAEYIGCKLPWQ
ncbi:MAG: sulfotransferase [Bacteroidota bacterium]